jgi:hypothetical protein
LDRRLGGPQGLSGRHYYYYYYYYYYYFHGSTALILGLSRFFWFLNPIHNRQDSLDRGSAHRKTSACTQDNTHTHTHTHTQTSIPRVEFEPTTLVFERTKTAHD